MAYHTYLFLISAGDNFRHIEVVACDIDAARADLLDAFWDVEIIQWGVK